MKKIILLGLLGVLLLCGCKKEEDTPDTFIYYDNAASVSTALQNALSGKSLAVIYTYQGDTEWESYFDPDYQFIEDFIIINNKTWLNLKYVTGFKLGVFTTTPYTIWELHLYFQAKNGN